MEKDTSFFYSLSPINQIEDGDVYFNTLKWVLDNRKEKNIKNIALTGPYGSGKSSILQSFQKINGNKNLHFLNISLATFKEEKETKDKIKETKNRIEETKDKIEGENLQRLIELSILQQLFYREKDRKLPDSRLKKINNFTWWKLWLTTICSFFFIMALILIIKPEMLLYALPNINFSVGIKMIIHYCSLIISTVGIIFIIRKSIRILHNLKISKLNINNAEIQISQEINKSVLNHNLEEILYFFEVTNYNVVIIEDLDRFQQTEIFAKLREINLLINNSEKINKCVVFIYAIRDDMFTDKERTKFFDFIIPVIPVINPSNSGEKLREAIRKVGENVSESLIEDISLFIDEMRVLYNIVNEYQIYRQILNNKLSQDKLLAMIVYKNIHPSDFVKLSNYDGDLYNIISKKHEYIKQQSDDIDEEIAECKEDIKKLDTLKIKDIKELRMLYVLQYINELNGCLSFSINNMDYTFTDVLQDELFDYFTKDAFFYKIHNYYSNSVHVQKILLKFIDIEKSVDEISYEERKEQIEDWNNNKIQELKSHICLLEQKKIELKQKKIKNLLSNKYISVKPNDKKQALVNLLLSNGHIDENYLDYISLFHEGSLSKNDYKFLLGVKSQTGTDFNHNLDNINNLIRKIHIEDFKKEYIFNYKLVDFILTNNGYEQQKNAIFSNLKNKADISMKFIDNFIDNGINIDLFIKELYHHQINIFDIMYQNSSTLDKRKIRYFKLVVENINIEDIELIPEKSALVMVISDNPNNNYNIFEFVSDDTKIKEILRVLNIKFSYKINFRDISGDILKYIYENNHYIIRVDLLKIMIQANGNFNPVDFNTHNYYAIKNSNCNFLINYIKENINDYILNVYLKLETNSKENEECLIELLNNEKLEEKNKIAIIQKIEIKIPDLEKINHVEIGNILLQNSKVKPNWKDLIDNYHNNKDEFKEHLLFFLNNKENAEILSKSKIEKDKSDEETVDKFLKAIILNNQIDINLYALILNSIPYYYSSLSFENLPIDNVKLLVEKNILDLNKENYNKLKNFNLHIKLIEIRKHLFSEKLSELLLEEGDIIELLKSLVLSTKEKNIIVDYYQDNSIIRNEKILEAVAEIILNDDFFVINNKVLKLILTETNIKTDSKISLFNLKYQSFNDNDITDFISSLHGFLEVSKNGSKTFIPYNETNENFASILKERKIISSYKTEEQKIKMTFRNKS
jgi:hypothetical protein